MIEVYTVQQVANILQVCKDTVYDLINQGKLRSVKLGKSIRIPEKFLQEYLYGEVPHDIELERRVEELERKFKEYEKSPVMLKVIKG